MLAASEDATSGSVMRKAERISPRSSGSSHCLFCSSEPYRSSVSMLPVSGAAQLKTSGARLRFQLLDEFRGHPGVALRAVRLDLVLEAALVRVDVLVHEAYELPLQRFHLVGV